MSLVLLPEGDYYRLRSPLTAWNRRLLRKLSLVERPRDINEQRLSYTEVFRRALGTYEHVAQIEFGGDKFLAIYPEDDDKSAELAINRDAVLSYDQGPPLSILVNETAFSTLPTIALFEGRPIEAIVNSVVLLRSEFMDALLLGADLVVEDANGNRTAPKPPDWFE